MDTAEQMVGSTRQGTPSRIAEMLALYQLPMKDRSGFVPFCAAGVGFSAALAYANLTGKTHGADRLRTLRSLLADIEHWYSLLPTVSGMGDMRLVEMGKRRWVDARPDKPVPHRGWIVLFAWSNPDKPDHCGIVMDASSHQLHTLEFNTSGTVNGSQINGGAVLKKHRAFDQKVMGFIATDRAPQF